MDVYSLVGLESSVRVTALLYLCLGIISQKKAKPSVT